MKRIFNLTNKYIILATPLILFSLFSTIYFAVAVNGKLINIIFALLLLFFMYSAFISGWGNMLKFAVQDDNFQDGNSLIKEFIPGIGEYFLPSSGALFTMFLINIIAIIISYFIGMSLIGDAGINVENLAKSFETTASMKAFLTTLAPEQLNKMAQWNFLLLITITFSYFLIMLYLPALFYKSKNPFIALFKSLKDLFSKKFVKTLGIYLIIFILNLILSVLSAIFANSTILHFVITLLNFYFLTFISLWIFDYYYNNFVKTLIGQNIDTKI